VSRRALVGGGVTLALAWAALARDGGRSFAVHMAAHMAVVAVAAPLLALGLSGGRFDVTRRAPAGFGPVAASLAEFAAVWSWHAPALHRAARHTAVGVVAEQACFLAAGLLVWLSALAPARRAEGVVALLLTSMHMTLLGALLALSPRALYPGCGGLDDQHLGGAFMIVAGGASYLAGGVALTGRLLHGAVRRA
jgi:putative membrane protein